MADSREPPPLFNEDREDDNDDLFTSAVQSPVSEQTTTPEDQRRPEDPLTPPPPASPIPDPPQFGTPQPDTSNDLFVSAVGPGVTESEGGHPELTSVPLDLPAGGEGEQQVSTVVQHLDLRPTSPCIASDLQPVTCTDPDTTDTKPTLGILFDLDTDPQPATCNLLDPQPVILDPQPASYTDLDTDPQTATCNLLDPQPASYTDLDLDTDPQTATCNLLDPQPVILDPQPASYTDLDLDTDPQTATCNLLDPQPASYTDLDLDTDPQPPTCNLLDSQPNTPEQQPQPATNLQEPTATTLMSDPTPLTPPILPHPCMALPQEQQAPPEALEAPSGTPPSPHEPSLAGQDKVAVTAPDPTLDLTSDPAFLHDPPSFLGETDTTEISLDEVVKTKEVSLEEEADEPDIFDTMSSPKLQLNQDTSEPPVPPSSILPPMGAPLTPPVVPVTPTATPSLTPNITPAAPTPVSPVTVSRSSPDQVEGEGSDEYIQIGVSDPQKIGDGMSSYMAYKVTTKTNVSYFRKKHWSVMRRFSDFLGLHRKLNEKHLHSGRVIPPAPEKSAIGTTKIKLGSDKNADSGSSDFIERRRAALERYMNRTSAHSTLRADPDFREFIELDAELPRATATSALSSAGVLRLFNRVGETVNKMTFKMDESDQWFEEKTQQIESLDAQLRKLQGSMEGLVNYRRDLALSTAAFAKATAVLSSVEEHSSLSRALHQLSESTERTHTIHHAQADADFYVLSENTKDYIHLIAAVKDVFHERVKTFQTWQHSQITLAKKREAKAKAELAGRMDKVQQAQEEVSEWEGKVERSQEEFERISKAIKKEMEQFDVMRVKDFRDMIIKYLEDLMTSQQQIIKVWETFIPEAKAIS